MHRSYYALHILVMLVSPWYNPLLMVRTESIIPGVDPNYIWWPEARCLDENYSTEIFFSVHGERGATRLANEARAKAVCAAGCPVVNECLEYALGGINNPSGQPEQFGVWGQTSEKERRTALSQKLSSRAIAKLLKR